MDLPIYKATRILKYWLIWQLASPRPTLGTYFLFLDWDFGVCLNYECRRKQLRKPAYFNQWIDIRAVYKVTIEHACCYTAWG